MFQRAEVQIDAGEPIICHSPPDLALHVGDQCVIEENRVPEFGRIVSLQEVEEGGQTGRMPRILRRATLQDQAKADENAVRNKMAASSCAALAAKQGLTLHFVSVRFSFDRAVLHILFTAEENIDARDLARALSTELHTRVDMKQIGVRDEAGLVGGMGACGRKLCCCTWLRHFESINVKMAKAQGLSLNPATMSGVCGRLKCCLRYEYDAYRQMARGMPRQGATVNCAQGRGQVVGRQMLRQRLNVRLEDGRIVDCPACDATEVWARKGKGGRKADEDTGAQRAQPGAAGKTRAAHLRKPDTRTDPGRPA
jgi:cell fate regulator YaaT (PSP1 superfamily)